MQETVVLAAPRKRRLFQDVSSCTSGRHSENLASTRVFVVSTRTAPRLHVRQGRLSWFLAERPSEPFLSLFFSAGRRAYVGVGFQDRNDAFDFACALNDEERYILNVSWSSNTGGMVCRAVTKDCEKFSFYHSAAKAPVKARCVRKRLPLE